MDDEGDWSVRRRNDDVRAEHALSDFDRSLARLAALGVATPDDERTGRFVPIWQWERLAAAAFDADGRVISATTGFPATDPQDVADAARKRMPAVLQATAVDGARCVFVVLDVARARTWTLPEHARRMTEVDRATSVGLSITLMRSADAIREASAMLGMTPLQAALVASLARHGDLDRAAAENAVAYSTARQTLADAMARAGARKRTNLVDRVLGLSFGVAAEDALGRDILQDAWGLTPRQMHLAAAVAAGAAREEAAASAGVSPAVAKKELSSVFLTLGVASGTELSAFLAEARALATLIAASGGDLSTPVDRIEPTALTPRPSVGGMIAFSDYGPKGAAPVLLLHSSSASRPAPARLVKALQARGWRPFAIDRPGFGLTDWIDGPGDPFARACDDVRTICGKLKFQRIDVVARGGAQVALHLAAQSPSLVGAVVLVAPDPPSRISRPTEGLLGAVKQAFQSNPALIEPLARLFVANLRTAGVRDLMLKAVRTSPADIAVMADRQNLSDYCRGFRMFLAGRLKGYVHEQSALVVEPDPPANAMARWSVLIGAQDPLHDPAETARYFRRLLPAAEITMLADAGRFVGMSHAELVVDRLAAQANA